MGMLRKTAPGLAAAVILACLATTSRADVVILHDGRRIEGEVRLEGDQYVIKSRFGTTVRVSKYEVREILKTGSSRKAYEKKLKALKRSRDRNKPEAWLKLASFAADNNLPRQAREAYRKVVALDPDHKRARRALGYVRHGGAWVTRDEAKALVTEPDPLESSEKSRPARTKNVFRSKTMRDRSKLVACPKCDGTGISVWITCMQCGRSGRPGYSNMGDYFRLCTRCKGKGKLPGIACRRCGGRGKIDPDKPWPPKKKRYIRNGYMECVACGGTGIETWMTCKQCSRSGHPGYLFMGDHYAICRKCRGQGRIPGIRCARCKGRGIVKMEAMPDPEIMLE